MTTLEKNTSFWRRTAIGLPAPVPAPVSRPQSLAEAVQAAVRVVPEAALRRVARLDAGLAFQPKILLALLTYCYARDIYASTEIEDALRRDAQFRQLCQNEFPGARVIRRFRRENRTAMHDCLMRTLRWQAEHNGECSACPASPTLLEEEADRRLTLAMMLDMESDD